MVHDIREKVYFYSGDYESAFNVACFICVKFSETRLILWKLGLFSIFHSLISLKITHYTVIHYTAICTFKLLDFSK